MPTGVVKFFNEEKGFGFIKPDTSGSEDIFVHATALEQTGGRLRDNDRVEYQEERGKKGMNAVRVKLLS